MKERKNGKGGSEMLYHKAGDELRKYTIFRRMKVKRFKEIEGLLEKLLLRASDEVYERAGIDLVCRKMNYVGDDAMSLSLIAKVGDIKRSLENYLGVEVHVEELKHEYGLSPKAGVSIDEGVLSKEEMAEKLADWVNMETDGLLSWYKKSESVWGINRDIRLYKLETLKQYDRETANIADSLSDLGIKITMKDYMIDVDLVD